MCGFLTSSILIDEVNNYTGVILRIACFDLNCPLFTCLDFWHRLSSIYYSILFPHVAMYVWTERHKCFVSCSDFVGLRNSLSNILTFLLSYTELITLTALELAIGFLEGFCYLLF